MTVYDLPHLALIEPIGDPVVLYRVTTETSYYINTPRLDELTYKTVTIVYPSDDMTTIKIVAEADLPEGAEILGDTNNDHVTE